MNFRKDTLYLGDYNNTLLVKPGEFKSLLKANTGLGYQGLDKVIKLDSNTLTIDVKTKNIIGKTSIKRKELDIRRDIIEMGGYRGNMVEKIIKDHFNGITRIEVIDGKLIYDTFINR